MTASVSVPFDASSEASPTSPEELAAALQQAAEAGQAIAPVGGGTQLDLGNPPSRRIDLALHTGGLNRVIEYEPADLTVTVEAGMPYVELQRQLGEHGQFLALDPPVEAEATIGGVIATNVSGPLRFAFGTARDLVIGTRVANVDGTLTRAGGRVVKNVAGYDLNKLYVGSLGTLAVIVELSFKLAPIPPAFATVVGQFESLAAARETIGAVLHSPLSPLAVELLAPGAAAAAGLPPAALLVFRVGGYQSAVERQVRDLGTLLGARRVDAPETFWDELARVRLEAARRDVVLKAAAPIAQSTTLVSLLQEQLAAFDPLVWSHGGNGVAFAACDAPPEPRVLSGLRQSVAELGHNSSLVVQRCPAELKTSLEVWGDPGSSVALMRAIKAKLDPRSSLNPGRYVGGI